jgi:hypothetical protein
MQFDILEMHAELSRFMDEAGVEQARILGELQRRHLARHIVMYRRFGEPPLYLQDRLGLLALQGRDSDGG